MRCVAKCQEVPALAKFLYHLIFLQDGKELVKCQKRGAWTLESSRTAFCTEDIFSGSAEFNIFFSYVLHLLFVFFFGLIYLESRAHECMYIDHIDATFLTTTTATSQGLIHTLIQHFVAEKPIAHRVWLQSQHHVSSSNQTPLNLSH